jgi:hypothetical protein
LRNGLRASLARTLAKARGRRTSWTAAMHDVVYHKDLSLEQDFRAEACEFFGCTEKDLRGLERTHGAFASEQFHEAVRSHFQGRLQSDDTLFGAYADAAFMYSMMLGAGCPRYVTLYPFLEHLLGRFARLGRRPVAIDYGCGVGDTAILLSVFGFEVHLVDLPDRKSEFAIWRLRRRGYRPKFIPVTSAAPYPALPNADLVVTIEVWEHLRHPVTALSNINAATTPGRSYLLNTNADFDHMPIGDHLADGMAEGKSDAYRRLYAASWRDTGLSSPDAGRLFQRV